MRFSIGQLNNRLCVAYKRLIYGKFYLATSNILTVKGKSFFSPVSELASIAREKGFFFMAVINSFLQNGAIAPLRTLVVFVRAHAYPFAILLSGKIFETNGLK